MKISLLQKIKVLSNYNCSSTQLKYVFKNLKWSTDKSFKIENPERPNKAIIYPFALIILLIVGYKNYRRKT